MRYQIITLISITFIVIGGLFFIQNIDTRYLSEHQKDINLSSVEKEIKKLPHKLNIENRTVVFDNHTVTPTSRKDYKKLPYKKESSDQNEFIESKIKFKENESPIKFIERFVKKNMPPKEKLEKHVKRMYKQDVSFYKIKKDKTDLYSGKEGLFAQVRMMGFPDKNIGGKENRFDFIKTEKGWTLVWQGKRIFCRRPNEHFWQPSNKKCP